MGVGMQYGISIALFTWAGTWLDGKFPDTRPLFTLLGFALGFIGGTVNLIHEVLPRGKDKSNERKP